MDPDKIFEQWKSYDNRLSQVLTLHRENSLEITRIKMRSELRSMSPLKIFAIIVGILWVVLLDAFLLSIYQHAGLFFLISMTIQSFITKIAVGIYIYQVVMMYQIDFALPVAKTQYKLGKLASSTLFATKVLFLQLPLWTTFFLSVKMFEDAGIVLVALQCFITLGFTWAAWWLFTNIRWENRNKRWFRFLFAGKEWTPLLQSIELSREIESLESASRE